MPSVDQPTGMQVQTGVILTIGVRANGDRQAIVLPLATDSAGLTEKTLCENAVAAAEGNLADLLDACMSESAYISFIQAEGMGNGRVPFRLDFAPADQPGTRAADCETSQVAAMIGFYADPADLSPGQRMKFGKNFIPGVADEDITGDAVISGLVTALDAFAQALAEGFPVATPASGNWYRVCAAPASNSPAEPVIRTGVWVSRAYTGTQRRRLLPH